MYRETLFSLPRACAHSRPAFCTVWKKLNRAKPNALRPPDREGGGVEQEATGGTSRAMRSCVHECSHRSIYLALGVKCVSRTTGGTLWQGEASARESPASTPTTLKCRRSATAASCHNAPGPRALLGDTTTDLLLHSEIHARAEGENPHSPCQRSSGRTLSYDRSN